MAYVKQGEREVWKYETEVLTNGDQLRVAYHDLCRAVEAYLFDYDAAGYARPEYLSWALEHSKATHNASGMAVNAERRWNPSANVENREPLDPAETGRSGNFFSAVITYRDPELDASKARSSEAAEDQGDDQGLAPNEVIDPRYGRLTNAEAVVVNPVGHVDGDGIDTLTEQADESEPVKDESPEVIETPADSYEARQDGDA